MGIYIFNPNFQRFHSVNLPGVKIDAINTTPVLSFVQAKAGDILVATFGQGIQVFDDHFQFKKTYAFRPSGIRSIGEPGNRVWCFLSRPDGKILIGCQHGWISIFDPLRGTFVNSQPEALNKTTIMNFVLDSAQKDICKMPLPDYPRWKFGKSGF
jgi:hypothetical protein